VTERALYVYGVVRAADAAFLPGGPGAVDERYPLETVLEGDLAALASEIDPAAFEQGLRETGPRELAWLEQRVRAHERALDRALGAGALVPFRFGTVVAGRVELRELLRERAAELGARLEAVRDADEWGVKVLVDRPRLEAALVASSPELAELSGDANDGPGHAFFARKRLERELGERRRLAGAELADSVHVRLAGCARMAAAGPPQSRSLSGHEGEMILNGAYLVERRREPELRAAVDALAAELANGGVRVELTGPWPAFTFAEGAA
jgi:hypothetical protein